MKKKQLVSYIAAVFALGACADPRLSPEGTTVGLTPEGDSLYALSAPQPDEPLIERTDQLVGSEIGSLNEALTIGHRGGTAAPGTRTANNNLMCDTTSTGQVCVVPRTKTLNWAITTPTGGSCVATANRQAQVRSQVNSWFQALKTAGLDNTWTLTEVAIGAPNVAFAVDVEDGPTCNEGFCTSGTLDQVERYSCITGTTGGLVEGAGLAGNYVKWVGGPVLHIDFKQLDDRGSTNARDLNLLRQAVFNGLHRIHGIGQLSPGNTRCATRENNFASTLDSPCIVQTTEACLLNSFGDTADQANLDYTATNCGT
jgi:hypothetical protein